MAIDIGDRLPNSELMQWDGSSVAYRATEDLVGRGKVIIVGVVGAFTPICTESHIRDYIRLLPDLRKAKLVDAAYCIAALDPFVLHAWANHVGAEDVIDVWSDPYAAFAKAIGITTQFERIGLGLRSGRYSLLAFDGVVQKINIEEDPTIVSVSGADILESQLKAA